MISLRHATSADSELLFEWRNDPTAYQHFFAANPVTRDEHTRWLEGVLKDPERRLYIILDEKGGPIGQVRFDVTGADAEISITLGQPARGLGYGTEAIAKSVNVLFAEKPTVHRIIARIKAENQSSIRTFARAGYMREKIDDGVVQLVYQRQA